MRGISRSLGALQPAAPRDAVVQEHHSPHPHRAVQPRGWAGARDAASAVAGAALGLLPHLLHHISLFAGALVITGAAGNLVLGTLGLLLSIPLLRRLYRRFGTWMAPAIALMAFAAMFSLSAFVIGPALSGADSDTAPTSPPTDTPEPGTPSDSADHDGHHSD